MVQCLKEFTVLSLMGGLKYKKLDSEVMKGPEKCTDLIGTFRLVGNFGIWEELGREREC